MTLTIKEVIKSVFRAIENQGISLAQADYALIEKEANKIIDNLLESYEKKKLYTRFTVSIPCNITQASLRNRTVREFLKTIGPAIEMEFELSNKTLTLVDSYDIFEGEASTFPFSMTVNKNQRPYSYRYEEA